MVLFSTNRQINPAILALLLGAACDSRPLRESISAPKFVPSTDGTSICYEALGLGRPALVFVHGWSCDRSYWQHQVEHFSRHHMVVALDLAGHGDSGWGRHVWTMEAFGQDVWAVVEKLDLDEVVLIGHAMGGAVILEAARRMSERVKALIPVETFFDVELKLSEEQAEQFLTPFRADFAAAAGAYLRQNMFTAESDRALREAIVTDLSQARPEVAIGALKELLTYDTPAGLRGLGAPIRCVNSTRYVTKTERARRFVPSFDVALIPGAGHFLMMEKPGEFNRLVAQAVSELVSQGPGSKDY